MEIFQSREIEESGTYVIRGLGRRESGMLKTRCEVLKLRRWWMLCKLGLSGFSSSQVGHKQHKSYDSKTGASGGMVHNGWDPGQIKNDQKIDLGQRILSKQQIRTRVLRVVMIKMKCKITVGKIPALN